MTTKRPYVGEINLGRILRRPGLSSVTIHGCVAGGDTVLLWSALIGDDPRQKGFIRVDQRPEVAAIALAFLQGEPGYALADAIEEATGGGPYCGREKRVLHWLRKFE